MSLNLVAFVDGDAMSDSDQGFQLVEMVRRSGGKFVPLSRRERATSAAGCGPNEDLLEALASNDLVLDETVLMAWTQSDADTARGLRLKIGSVTPSVRGDENWRDLAEAAKWFERQAQLTKRAWPIATVGGLVFAPDGTALFVRTAKWSGTWGVPGGKIDYGEGHLDAFLREIREETGLDATLPEFVLVQDAIEESEFFRPRHFVLLNYRACTTTKAVRLNHESLEAGWFSLPDSLHLNLNRPTRLLVEHLLALPRI